MHCLRSEFCIFADYDTQRHRDTEDNLQDILCAAMPRCVVFRIHRSEVSKRLSSIACSEQPVQQHDIGHRPRHGRIDVLTVARPRHAARDGDRLIAEVGHRLHWSTRGR